MFEENPFYHGVSPFGDDTLLSLGVLGVILCAVGLVSLQIFTRRMGQARTGRKQHGAPMQQFDPRKMHLPQHQMHVVAAASFEVQPLLNGSEARLLPVIESALATYGRGHRVMAQTSLGELLRPCHERGQKGLAAAARAAINSKRLDFAIVDRSGRLVAAVEYQGSGHYGRTAFMRDAVKREVCRKAGVPFIEVKKGMRPSELTETLGALLSPGTPASTAG
ncbi:DUF2726 domain-containing protein [Roseovarius salis]|uniref:DUF2726 domain-containing protein n=1 Tax=Roseovarius salis TaxID=3376063 RepID=UPI0037CA32F5